MHAQSQAFECTVMTCSFNGIYVERATHRKGAAEARRELTRGRQRPTAALNRRLLTAFLQNGRPLTLDTYVTLSLLMSQRVEVSDNAGDGEVFNISYYANLFLETLLQGPSIMTE